MTDAERDKVLAAMQPLDQFAGDTNLGRGWHVRWQQILEHVQANIGQLVTKPDKAEEKPTKAA